MPHYPKSITQTLEDRESQRRNSDFAATNGLEVIRKSLGLSASSPRIPPCRSKAPILFAIDLENMSSRRQRRSANYQLGVAIFDPQQPNRAISTYNFVGGSTEYFAKAGWRFLFGQSFRVEKHLVAEYVKSLYPESRDIILVAHNLSSELRGLNSLGIPLQFKCGLDTQSVARELFPALSHPPKLNYLTKLLDIPTHFRHCAGNDAHVELVALLALACCQHKPGVNPKTWKNISLAVQNMRDSIAKTYPPVMVYQDELKKLEKKREHCRHMKVKWEENAAERLRLRATKKRPSFNWSEEMYHLDSLFDAK
jgi:hypothetical protein